MTERTLRLGDRVTLHYRLSCSAGEIANTFADGPETFVLGTGEIDPRLELLLTGLTPGAHHLFQLAPWQAFGEHDETLVRRLPREEFPPDQELPVGHSIDFTLPNGQTLTGTLLDVDEEHARVDFNHPLAGLPVEFEFEILSID